jgi:serine/threonine protein kinase
MVKVREWIKTENTFHLVMDYCNGGSLEQLLDHRIAMSLSLNYSEVKCIITQIIMALRHLQIKNFIHRDIKPQNIMLNFTEIHGS